jgi:hypothetical protein
MSDVTQDGIVSGNQTRPAKSGSYGWPQTLRLPSRPPKLVYLDLNQWIALAKAMAGHRDGEAYKEVLTRCLGALDRGEAVFPISDSIYTEISKNGSHRQRRDLLEVIEPMSRFMVVMCRSIVSAHEIEAMLDRIAGPSRNPINSMDYLDWGVARAFGMVGGFKWRSSSGEDVTAEVRSAHADGPAAFDSLLSNAELEVNRSVITGPAPDEEPEMRKRGWNPASNFEIAGRRAAQEIEQVSRFDQDPRWRQGRIRDVVAAREVEIEIHDALSRGLSLRGTTIAATFPVPEDTRSALDSMPSFDVAVTLKTAYHRNPSHPWTQNDIHDIDAMGSTVPYCDIVVTDKAVASHANQTKLAERLGTIVISQLSDLPQHL